MHPGDRVRLACERWGDAEVVHRCMSLLRLPPETVVGGGDLDLAITLGDVTERDWLAGGKPPGRGYWARVWAARALLYVWADEAAPAVVEALHHEHWRVREMAAKVVLARELPEAAEALVHGTSDPVSRVAVASARALAAVGEAEHAAPLRRLREDPEPRVAAAGNTALRTLSRRLDRLLD